MNSDDAAGVRRSPFRWLCWWCWQWWRRQRTGWTFSCRRIRCTIRDVSWCRVLLPCQLLRPLRM